jgi:O-antigen/teichoic acid export membrane protein
LVDFGLNSIVVKEFYDRKIGENKILSGTILIKFSVGILCLTILNGYTILFSTVDQQTKILLAIISTALIFRINNVFDYWFEANVKGKFPAINRISALTIISILKIVGIIYGYSIYFFAVLFSFEYFIQLVGIFYLYSRGNVNLKWVFRQEVILNLVRKSWLLVLSGLATILYLKIDLVMLGMLVDSKEVGIYSVAARLSETWYFIPATIASGIFPKIIKYKGISEDHYNSELLKILKIFFYISLTLSVFISFASSFLVDFLYGKEFNQASKILSLHIWASIFVFSGAIFSKWLVVENKLSFSLLRQITGAVLNIILNFILIPLYGGWGAAISTLVSYSVANYWITLIDKRTLKMFVLISKSYLSPFYLIMELIIGRKK